MKYVLLGILAALLIASMVPVLWRPQVQEDRIPIVWTTDDNPIRRHQIELFNSLHTTYRVVLDPANNMLEKVIVQSLAGVGPDVFDCYDGYWLHAFVRSGVALDCTDEMARRGVYAESMWPCVLPHTVLDGRLYGHAGNASPLAVWYNKKLFREAGIPEPTADWTWDECIDIAKRLTKVDDRGRPIQFGLMVDKNQWRLVFLGQWGANVFSPEGTRCILDAPAAQDATQFYADLIHKHHVIPTVSEETAIAASGGWGNSCTAQFAEGRGAMSIGGRWWLCLLRLPDFAGLELGAVTMPHGPTDRLFGEGRSSIVNKYSKNLEGALDFVAFMNGPEWNALVNKEADALGPVKKYHYGEYEQSFLHNPEHPEEEYNLVWRTAMENSVPEPASPFVNGNLVSRILLKHTDLMREGGKSGRQTMIDAAKEINAAIRETLKRDPELKTRYDELVAQGAPSAAE
ncbi:MAG TPA: extracellular solute-binding protein [Candidatus Hydrogenedentes bacterium]|nr:extracellular solute-binding protein [Candidatus Hydrogenedentota bacterium]